MILARPVLRAQRSPAKGAAFLLPATALPSSLDGDVIPPPPLVESHLPLLGLQTHTHHLFARHDTPRHDTTDSEHTASMRIAMV
ncbi:unnamed protein product [Parajaminaea phylloscopi]